MTLSYSKPIKKKVRKPEKVEGGSRFEVHSGGAEHGNFSKIMINHETIATCKTEGGCTGLNVVAVDAFTHKIIAQSVYDTTSDEAAPSRFMEMAKGTGEGTIFLVSIQGHAINMSQAMKAFFAKMGSAHITALAPGDSWAFVGVKGQEAFTEERGTTDPVGTGAILGYAKRIKHYKKETKITGGSKIEVHSAGKDGKGGDWYARVLINEKEVFTNKEAKRGLNLVALDFETHKVVFKATYDTHGKNEASTQLLSDFKEKLPEYCIVVVGVKDEAQNRLSSDVKRLFKSLGSKAISNLRYREAWAFIGVKGMQKASEKRGDKANKAGTAMIIGYGKITKKEVRKQIKNLPKKVKGGSRIEVQSAGFTTGNFATINVANKMLVSRETAKRGLNVVALEPFKHEIILNANFDTYASAAASAKFVKIFKKLPTGAVVIIGVKDEASRSLSGDARAVIAFLGS